ncbi:MAG: T9SS type A sorting domain-containing protein [Flavobacteriales bacterium]
MKKNILTSIGLTAFFAVAIVSLNVVSDSGTTSVYANSGGSPGGKTSSPGDVSNCTQCHSGTINSGSAVSGIVAAGLLTSGYVPGQTYTITGSISEAGITEFGFELTAEKDADNSKVGTFILTDAVNTKFVNSSNAVSHTAVGTTPLVTGVATWSMDWTAPTVGTGDVTFYAAFNATNNNGTTVGDNIYSKSFSVTEDLSTALVEESVKEIATIFPNPVKTAFQISTTEVIDNVVVYNLAGKKMSNVNQTLNKFDVRSLASGIYFVQIESEGNVMTKKIIKE